MFRKMSLVIAAFSDKVVQVLSLVANILTSILKTFGEMLKDCECEKQMSILTSD